MVPPPRRGEGVGRVGKKTVFISFRFILFLHAGKNSKKDRKSIFACKCHASRFAVTGQHVNASSTMEGLMEGFSFRQRHGRFYSLESGWKPWVYACYTRALARVAIRAYKRRVRAVRRSGGGVIPWTHSSCVGGDVIRGSGQVNRMLRWSSECGEWRRWKVEM